MNALYATPDGTVVDPLGGLSDLRAHRLRFVGDPAARIEEDYLRVLRFFRFHAWYGTDGLDAEGLAACAAAVDGLDGLSRERVGAEMRKLLYAPDPTPSLAAMAVTGVLARLLRGADVQALALLVHLENGRVPRWLRRLAVLGGEDPVRPLRLSRVEKAEVGTIRAEISANRGAAELGWRHGADIAADIVLARAALSGSAPGPGWEAEIAQGAAAVFPVRASDLMPALDGPALGEKLRVLESRWVASGFSLTREELLG